MAETPRARHFNTDSWLLEQQFRAEVEAEAWRRLRLQLAGQSLPMRGIAAGRSLILNTLARLVLAGAAAGLAWIAALDAGAGAFEAWLAGGAGFLVMLALSVFDPVRRLTHATAAAMGWTMLAAAVIAALWLMTHVPA